MDWSSSGPEQLFLKQVFVFWTKSWSLHKQRVSLREHEPGLVEVKQGRAQSGRSGGGKSPRPEDKFYNTKNELA
jgi:hypothetical protein